MNSSLDGSLPLSSSGSVPNLDGALLVLPDRVIYAAVVSLFVALPFASAHGNGLLPSYSVFCLS